MARTRKDTVLGGKVSPGTHQVLVLQPKTYLGADSVKSPSCDFAAGNAPFLLGESELSSDGLCSLAFPSTVPRLQRAPAAAGSRGPERPALREEKERKCQRQTRQTFQRQRAHFTFGEQAGWGAAEGFSGEGGRRM